MHRIDFFQLNLDILPRNCTKLLIDWRNVLSLWFICNSLAIERMRSPAKAIETER